MKVKSFNDEKNEFEGEAYFGITDMAKDKEKAEKEKFTKKAVTLYPDNSNPGKKKFKRNTKFLLNW